MSTYVKSFVWINRSHHKKLNIELSVCKCRPFKDYFFSRTRLCMYFIKWVAGITKHHCHTSEIPVLGDAEQEGHNTDKDSK
jgi:hypothetical protein